MMLTEQSRRQELATFLVSRRNRLRPQDFGIAVTRRRRAEGLRREEVAQHAGISTTWYVRLEQGRDVRASAHTLQLLGKALRLTRSEQAYMFQLARPDLDWKSRIPEQSQPSDSLLCLLEGLAPHPAYVVNRYWQVVAMNQPATKLLGAFRQTDEWSNSLLARLFLDSEWRLRFADWHSVARSAVAQFRMTAAAGAEDPVLSPLIAMLEDASEEFSSFWHEREIAEPPIWRKIIHHPVGGQMEFDFATFRPAGRDGDFFVSLYTPVGGEDRERMAKLLDGDRDDPVE